MNIFDLVKKKQFDELFNYIKNNSDIDLDIYDENYNYFIQYIVMYNLINILKYILENRTIRLDIIDTDGRNLLYYPIKYDYFEILELLLEYDMKNIGISIIDVRDNMGYNGFHYSIIFNNIKAFNLLYKSSSIDTIDNKGNNIYNICLQYKRSNILITILENEIKKNHNINHFINYNGESILQSAVNYDDIKVINYIINNTEFLKQIINNKENEYGLTVLHQCIVLHLNDIVIKLIKNGANINTSDYLGNTPLHYAVIEKNYMILDYIANIQGLFFSESNMNGNTPLHLLIDEDIVNHTIIDRNKYQYDIYGILLKMITNTDLNIMNNNGNTIMHYIAMKNLWKLPDINQILINGNIHMNIFIINREGRSVLNIVEDFGTSTKELFINMIIDSYYNILKSLKGSDKLIIPWEKYCSINNKVSLLKELNKRDNGNNIMYYCKNAIKTQITENNHSMPTYMELTFNVDTGVYTEGCFYTGSTIDILFGLVYLNINHNITLLLEYPLTQNKEIEDYYIKMGLNYSFKMEFSNIEIVWSFMKLIYPTNFESILLNKKDAKFIIIPLGIEVSNGSHANIIIIDINKKTIERFEPNGKNPPRGFYYNPNLLDTLLSDKFNIILPEYKYVTPNEYLPTIGFQILETIDEDKCKKIGDPNGFCAVWCVWWAEQKIINYNIESNKLVEELIKQMKFSNKSFKKLIRNYSINIVKLRDVYLHKYNINIDDWMVGNYDEDIINSLEKNILEKIN
jgi:ankyrin repeat protein